MFMSSHPQKTPKFDFIMGLKNSSCLFKVMTIGLLDGGFLGIVIQKSNFSKLMLSDNRLYPLHPSSRRTETDDRINFSLILFPAPSLIMHFNLAQVWVTGENGEASLCKSIWVYLQTPQLL